jgi:hypothetical protein
VFSIICFLLIGSSISFAQSIKDLSLYDIKLGDQLDVVIQKLSDKNYVYEESSPKFSPNEPGYVAPRVSFVTKKNPGADVVMIGQLEDNTVWYIFRGQKFSSGENPSLKSIEDMLLSRYGNDAVRYKVSDEIRLSWTFDKDGNLISFRSGKNREYSDLCAHLLYDSFSYTRLPSTFNAEMYKLPCYYKINANIYRDTNDFVQKYEISMVDMISREEEFNRNLEKERTRADNTQGDF